MSTSPVPSAGGRLVTLDGRELPLRATSIAAHCAGGLGRVELEQVFHNPHAEPLRVTYQVPLPVEGAVTGYRFRFGDEEVVGRVETKQAARAQFEEAILEGRTAALLEEERSSLFTQEVGNVPPGEAVVITITVDQTLAWVREAGRAGWEWRFPTVVGPRYLGTPGRVADAKRIATTHTEATPPIAVDVRLDIGDTGLVGGPDSPSHALAVEHRGRGCTVALASERAALDRDVVVRWNVAQADPGVGLETHRPPAEHARASDAFALLTVTPPHTPADLVPRDLIVLLDTSGSMGGQPLAQAKRVVSALIDGLGERDRLELIEFSMQARRWQADPVFATPGNRAHAQRWLSSLRAGGGTEMKTGLLAALSGLRSEAQRQVVLVSDGYIGFEAEIVGAIVQGLPPASRLHALGVGSAVNRSLTKPAARAGRGVEVVIGIDEDPERATQRLLAATHQPVLVDLAVSGDAVLEVAPARPHDLLAGAPAMLPVRIKPEGGTLVVHGRTAAGSWERHLCVPALGIGEGAPALAALFAREAVEDLEMRRAAGESGGLDAVIERYGIEFQISTRLTSWVAVSRQRTVDPSRPTRATTVPHALPHGTSVAGFGLRQASTAAGIAQNMAAGPGVRARRRRGAPPAPGRSLAAPAKPKAPPQPLQQGEVPKGGAKKEAAAPHDRRRQLGRADKADAASGGAPPLAGRPEPPSAAPVSVGNPADGGDAFGEIADRELIAEGDDFGAVEEAAAAPPTFRREEAQRVTGTWARVGARWVFSVAVPEDGLDWSVPPTCEVELSDGTTRTLALRDASTAAGRIAGGATLRIIVAVPADIDEQTPIGVATLELRVELTTP